MGRARVIRNAIWSASRRATIHPGTPPGLTTRRRRPVVRALALVSAAAVASAACAAGAAARLQDGERRTAGAPNVPSPGPKAAVAGIAAAGPVPVLAADPLPTLRPTGANTRDLELQVVPVEGQTFTRALRLRTAQRPPLSYNIQITARTVAPVEKDDVLLATFFLRGIESADETGEARATMVFEQASDPYTRSLQLTIGAPPGGPWQRVDMPFKAADRYAAGQAQVNFQVGYAPQTLEIGGVSVANYQKSTPLADLPVTRLTYPGRDLDAAWRAGAAARIEALRKAELRVVVRDAAGAPLRGAAVAVRQRRHAFGFGSAVAAAQIMAQNADGQRYRDVIAQHFNLVVMENDLKWPQWDNPAERPRTLQALQWLRDQGLATRGHNLVWPSWRYLPPAVGALRSDPAALRRRVAEHILEEAGALAGQLADWDVVNEPYQNHDVMDVLARDATAPTTATDVMADWFRLARQADPGARLFVNEATVPASGDAQDHLEQALRSLLAAGAPVGGIGIQCHYGSGVTPPDTLLRGLDRFAQLGLPIRLTEFDVDVLDERFQADYTRDLLTAAFSHPAVDAVLLWGFWEGRHWRPDAALYRRDWSVKPNGQAWLDLVKQAWWTDTQGTTDASGAFQTRAFLGEHTVQVSQGAATQSVPATVTASGATLEVVLPAPSA